MLREATPLPKLPLEADCATRHRRSPTKAEVEGAGDSGKRKPIEVVDMTDDPKAAEDRGSSSNSCFGTALSLGRCRKGQS